MEITPDQAFNADDFSAPVVGIAAKMGQHDSGRHSHQRHQLLFAASGCITIELADTLCLLPPSRAAWIPANTMHRAMMRGVMDYRSLYFTPSLPLSALPLHIAAVNPLLFAVIERMAFWPWDMPADQQQSLLTVFTQEMQQARHENWRLSYPRDRRLQGWLTNVHQGGLPPRLQQLAQKIGASERTISRIFIQETGMNYQSWRQQWRLLKAIELLADGAAIHHVAQQLEFISDSAFICFFRQHTGVTPMHYAREHLSIR